MTLLPQLLSFQAYSRCLRLFFIIAFLLIIFISNTTSQVNTTLKFDYFSPKDGLSGTSVLCILQDQQGFLWFGTTGGLNRFDGLSFKEYKNIPGDSTSLSNNYIQAIVEDRNGLIWVGTGTGLSCFDPTTEKFKVYKADVNNPFSLEGDNVYSLFEGHNGDMWVGTLGGGGLHRLDRRTGKFYSFQHDPNDPTSISHDEILSIFQDRWGSLWVGTYGGGLNQMDLEKETFIRYQHDPQNPYSLPDNNIVDILEDDKGKLFLGSLNGGTIRFDQNQNRFYTNRSYWAWSLHKDQRNRLWVAAGGPGIFLFDKNLESPTRIFRSDLADPFSIRTNATRVIHQDREGNYWFGNWDAGVNRLSRTAELFEYLPQAAENKIGLQGLFIASIHEDTEDDVLWISDGLGLNRWDRGEQTIKHFRSGQNSSNQFRAIVQSENNILWLGGTFGLRSFDSKKEKFKAHPFVINGEQNRETLIIHDLLISKNGLLWIASERNGLIKMNLETGEFQKYGSMPNSKNIITLYEDHNNHIWFGSNSISSLDPEQETFTHYINDPNNPNSISPGLVYSIYEDRHGNIWVGPSGGGLNKLDRQTSSFTHYRKEDGLPGEMVFGILEDKKGNLWMNTNRGLCKFNPETEQFYQFDVLMG